MHRILLPKRERPEVLTCCLLALFSDKIIIACARENKSRKSFERYQLIKLDREREVRALWKRPANFANFPNFANPNP